MFEFLGMIIGCWFIYMIIALIFKHKVAVICLGVVSVGSLFTVIMGYQSISFLISNIVCLLLVYFIKGLQVRNNVKKVDKK